MTTEIKSTLYVYRLSIGYDVLATLHPGDHVLGYPMRVFYNVHQETGGTIIQLVPWLGMELFEDPSTVKLKDRDVLMVAKASPMMHELYEKTLANFKKKIADGEFTAEVKQLKDLDLDSLTDSFSEEPPTKLN